MAAIIESWRDAGQSGVIACSALKRRYRDVITRGRPDVLPTYHKGEKDLIARRLAARYGHFMPATLLDGQFADLEEPAPEEGVPTIEIDKPPEAIEGEILAADGG